MFWPQYRRAASDINGCLSSRHWIASGAEMDRFLQELLSGIVTGTCSNAASSLHSTAYLPGGVRRKWWRHKTDGLFFFTPNAAAVPHEPAACLVDAEPTPTSVKKIRALRSSYCRETARHLPINTDPRAAGRQEPEHHKHDSDYCRPSCNPSEYG